jgi:predicted DNA-binding protein
MSRKKISTTIYVTPEQSDRLKLLHERTKVPVAVYIREGIDLVLRQYEHLLPGQLALGEGVGREAAGRGAAPASIPPAEDSESEPLGSGSSSGAGASGPGPSRHAPAAVAASKK